MYCARCGCKINMEDRVCPECNSEIRTIEYNGGFWGLVGEKPMTKVEKPVQKQTSEEKKVTPVKRQRVNGLLKRLVVILLIVCLIQSLCFVTVLKMYKAEKNKNDVYTEYYETYQQQLWNPEAYELLGEIPESEGQELPGEVPESENHELSGEGQVLEGNESSEEETGLEGNAILEEDTGLEDVIE